MEELPTQREQPISETRSDAFIVNSSPLVMLVSGIAEVRATCEQRVSAT